MFRAEIRNEIEKIVPVGTVFSVERPENPEHGDYSSNIALVLAKKNGRNPKEVAEEIKKALGNLVSKWIEKIEVAGPGFLNFWITQSAIIKNLQRAIKEGKNFGKNNLLEGKKIIVEYTDPNPAKEFHIGHLMSNSIGESLAKIIHFNGAEVKRANYQGDVGMHIAYTLTYLMEDIEKAGGHNKWAQNLSSLELGRKIFATYAAGVKKSKEDKEFLARTKKINIKIYDRSDQEINKYHKFIVQSSLKYFEDIYGIIGMKKLANGKYFDEYFFESETGPKGKEIVKANLCGVFEESDGAIVFRGEKYGLHTRVFINSDDLPTYEAKELGLAVMKSEKYPDYYLSIVVTGNEVVEYFKVVLAAEKQIYPELVEKTKHVSHGMLRLTSGKMSSRTGDVITAEWLYEEVKSKLKQRFEHNERLLESERERILNAVALGAIKYSILRHSIGSDIVFDFEKSLAFDGDSGPYIQYVYARANSILEKAGFEEVSLSFVNPPKELSHLERLVLYFPDAVFSAHENLNPNIICRYLLELSGEFNNFYERQKIVGVPESAYYVALTKAVSIVIKNGLNLLGIDSPDRM